MSKIAAAGAAIPLHGLAFGADGATATPVDQANPLPTETHVGPSGVTPLTGTITTSQTVGPFAPVLGRPIIVTLSGTWAGSVTLQRSTDDGATKLPITLGGQTWGVFTSNVNEPVWEESEAGVTYWLSASISSGSLSYRCAQ